MRRRILASIFFPASRGTPETPAPPAPDREVTERLAGGVAHDLNNILLVVRGYVELALAESDLGERAGGYLREVMTAMTRASHLVNDLLAVARRAPSSLGEMDLNAVVRRALEQVRASHGVMVDFVAGSGLPRLVASEEQAERCIAGLVAFALERTPAGGRLSLETSLEPGDTAAGTRVVFRLAAPDASVSAEEQAHLFEPFYASPSTGRRLGLGLAAARGVVLLMGGDIQVEGLAPGGVRITGWMPARRESFPPVPQPAGGTVLLAEDDAGLRDLASRVLGREGFHVLSAADGEEALRIFERNREAIRIAILDDVMPRLSGGAVVQRIRQVRPSLPVILCTGYSWGDKEAAVQGDNAETLAKPYEARDLLRCVRRVLGG